MASNVIPSDTPVTLDVIKLLTTLDQNAIVRPNNPPAGVAGFLFDVDLDQKAELNSDITDHYVENNTAVQDHIALRPELITLHGLVAELVYNKDRSPVYTPPINPLPNNVTMMPAKTPGFLSTQLTAAVSNAQSSAVSALFYGGSVTSAVSGSLQASTSNLVSSTKQQLSLVAQSAVKTLISPSSITALVSGGPLPLDTQNAVNVLKTAIPSEFNTLLSAVKAFGSPAGQQILTGSRFSSSGTNPSGSSLFSVYTAKQPTQPDQTKQSSAYLYFYNLWKSRQIFSVETPWGIYTNMAIQSLRATQNEETKYETDFYITFKKIHIAQDVSVSVGQLAGRNTVEATVTTPDNRGIAGTQTVPLTQVDQWLATLFK